MPRLSLTMKEGTVGKWYKKEGDSVERNEPLVEVVSEKATYDVEAPASGILRKILVEAGAMAKVDEVLAVITAPDEAFSEADLRTKASEPSEEPRERILASPASRRLARELGIDISPLKGTGPEGRIVEEDVQRFADTGHVNLPKIKEVTELSGYRKTSAERVSASFRTAPHSTIMMEIDVSKVTDLHNRLEVSYTAIIVKAASKALVEHSTINSTLAGDQVKAFADVNVGVAVATEHGLVVPVIRNADCRTLQETDTMIKDLSEKARTAKLTKEEVTGGTFTITNLGMYGVDSFTPIINPPEAAILGVGAIKEKPIVVGGRIEIRSIMTLSLSYDHRIVDGAPAAAFLRSIKDRIEKALEPES